MIVTTLILPINRKAGYKYSITNKGIQRIKDLDPAASETWFYFFFI